MIMSAWKMVQVQFCQQEEERAELKAKKVNLEHVQEFKQEKAWLDEEAWITVEKAKAEPKIKEKHWISLHVSNT